MGRRCVSGAVDNSVRYRISRGNALQKGFVTVIVFLLLSLPSLPAESNSVSVRMVAIDNPVYTLLEILEARGVIPLQPMAKPYTARTIRKLLRDAIPELRAAEQEIVTGYIRSINDLLAEGVPILADRGESNPVALTLQARTLYRQGFPINENPDNSGTTLSFQGIPSVLGELGDNLFYNASLGIALEKYAPDIFYTSYTRDGAVHFPYADIGFSALPYQFSYDTVWWHANADTLGSDQSAISETLHWGFTYKLESTLQLFDDKLIISANNQRRYWGESESNLILSSTARRLPGIELRLQPAEWISYSYLTGSLYYYPQQRDNYKKDIYGYDLGSMQKNYTLNAVELSPTDWLSVGLSSMNIWPKRFELAYMVPFLLPFFNQIDQSDSDNLAMAVDAAVRLPYVGKLWFSLFMDEISFNILDENFLDMPRNRYAFQTGIEVPIPDDLLPMTKLSLQYTKVTPFVYTHYPEDDFAVTTYADGTVRPVDQTFTHDGFNLGFYLPPNSDELDIAIETIASTELIIALNGKLIRHGTNNLNSATPQIFGDIYQHQGAIDGYGVYDYPLMDFTNDGIYDWSVIIQGEVEYSPAQLPITLTAGIGYGRTWWVANDSGVTSPDPRDIIVGSVSVVL